MVAAEDGNLPPICKKTNAQGAPIFMLISQAVLVTLLSLLFLLMPSVNSSYWLLTALAAQLYMLMYIMMFLAAIKLRIAAPKARQGFRIPGGLPGLVTVAVMGLIGTLATIVVSFFPPESINIGSTARYEFTLITGLILMLLPPFIFARKSFKKAKIPVPTTNE